MTKPATVIIAAPEIDSNLYYTCRFLAPDPIVYLEIKGRKYLILSDLEIDRAKLDSNVHVILNLSEVYKKISKSKIGKYPSYALIVDALLNEKKIKSILVPTNFPANYYESLKKLGYKITIKADPFYENRLVKTIEEKNNIRQTVIQVEKTLHEVLTFLQNAKIVKNRIYSGKEVVTSEMLQSMINSRLMQRGCVATGTIVASGVQGSFPHHHGSGAIKPHTPIIFDIFPRNAKTLYWGDMTRTIVKGKPTDVVKKMYEAVYQANKRARDAVKPGVTTDAIHQIAVTTLEKYGFKTGANKGRMEGFIHSTGHGLGLDIHELPSVSRFKTKIKKGFVITIEPGLYYQKHGGIRIEDDLFVTKDGYEILTKFPKFLELDKAQF